MREAIPIPERVKLIESPVSESEVLVSVKFPFLLAITVSLVGLESVSEPVPDQPVTVKLWLPPVSVRLATVTPERVRFMLSVLERSEFVSVKLAFLLAITVSVVTPEFVSEPVPDQPPTVKLWPPPVSVRLATAISERVRLIVSPVSVSELLVSVKFPLLLAMTVPPVRPVSVSEPVPVQPVTVKL